MKEQVRIAAITGIASVISALGAAWISIVPQVDKKISTSESNVRNIIQMEIDRLEVSTAGAITSQGTVIHDKGFPFSAVREPEGRFRVNYFRPFKTMPIVVASPVDSQTLINILHADRTGFSVEGVAIPSGSKVHAAFNFILVQPEMTGVRSVD